MSSFNFILGLITLSLLVRLEDKINRYGENTSLGFNLLVFKVELATKPQKRVSSAERAVRKRSKKVFSSSITYASNVSWRILPELERALLEYDGPLILVTSAYRSDNPKSKHYSGRAIDVNFSKEFIEYLGSEKGMHWLTRHGLEYYIEGRPKSKRVSEYVDDEHYGSKVFFNPRARGKTGDHIHLWLK